MDICKMLIICAAHVSPKTFEALEQDNLDIVTYRIESYMDHLDGFFILVSDFEDRENLPEDLLRCLSFANEQGCQWLRLDLDAERVDGLPTYKWEE